MSKWIIAGCGTDVGKTVVAAIVTTMLKADYWKPIQCGAITDTTIMHTLLAKTKHRLFAPAYSLHAPLSPHHAARLEDQEICPSRVLLPATNRPLVIEGVGGVLVPLTNTFLSIDLFKQWKCNWILVSRHYVGSINHTLLTIESLKQRDIPIAGLIFNGEPNADSERAILEYSKLPCLGRVFPETRIDFQTIQKYAKTWKNFL